jgi:N-acetylgalactosamine-6-sulfatase
LLVFVCLAYVDLTFAQARRPNVILILADDLGYGDLGCYGNPKNQTPNLDALARKGIRFTDFHASSAVGTPTRAGLLTGRAPARYGITASFPDGSDEYLKAEIITLPELLKEAGYQTVHIGHWQLGGLRRGDLNDRTGAPPGPLQHGFDHYLAIVEAVEPRARLVGARQLQSLGGRYLVQDDRPIAPRNESLLEIEIAEAERWIDAFHAQRKPFYLNLWLDAPLASNEAGLSYGEGLARMDAAVGRIVQKLDQSGITNNSLLIFLSDNGPIPPGSAGLYRGGKGTLFEGGLRVPMIAAWNGVLRASAISNEFASSIDLLPTICEAAGTSPPKALSLDGQSLLGHLKTGRRIAAREAAFWLLDEHPAHQKQFLESPPYATEAVRWGRWKLLARDAQPMALYYLENDPRESRNLIEHEPRIRDQLVRELRAWLSTSKLFSK